MILYKAVCGQSISILLWISFMKILAVKLAPFLLQRMFWKLPSQMALLYHSFTCIPGLWFSCLPCVWIVRSSERLLLPSLFWLSKNMGFAMLFFFFSSFFLFFFNVVIHCSFKNFDTEINTQKQNCNCNGYMK